MSFGFAIGDFIAVGDKAWDLYQKCKSAKGDYETLDDHVRILHDVLKEVNAFVSEGDIPEVQNERSSLVAARENCRATLKELDAFLIRHAGLVNESRKRKFELAKFIVKDVKSLKAKLDHSTKLLQLSLQSLQMYSVNEIRSELKDILREYRSGAREPTVVSQAIFSNKQADAKTTNAEVTQQIHADLEDKDIHPVSISLNDKFIQQWVEKMLEDGGLEESIDTITETAEPDIEPIPDKSHQNNSPTTTHALTPLDRTIEERSVPPVREDDAEETPSILPNYPGGPKTLNVDDDLSRPPSRTESVSSHRSKPDDWRPYDTPNPGWVRDMLLPLFNRDPFVDVAETNPDLRIKRAFHQQDYDRKGAIADHKVLRLCEDLLKSIGLSERFQRLRATVYSMDADGNGQFDEAEYMTLMKILILTAMDLKKDMLSATLSDYGTQAGKPTGAKGQSSFLPWGWSVQKQSGHLVYHDTIADLKHASAPSLSAISFTIMAEKARTAIEKIDDFEERWLKIVPKELQRSQEFKAPLEAARELAYRFIPFENPIDRQTRSDLDTMICFSQILHNRGTPMHQIPFPAPELQEASRYVHLALHQIWGFVTILEKISHEVGNHDEAHYYPKLNEKLRSYQVALLAKQLTFSTPTEQWNKHVTKTIERCRNANALSLLKSLEPDCKLLATRYYNRICHALNKSESELLKWSVTFEKVEIWNWTMSRSRRLLDTNKKVWGKIYVVDGTSKDLAAAIPPKHKRSENISWELNSCRHAREDRFFRTDQ
ncbi:unnamed protein product [Periconia digitata]|uniref:EF-hand domain-containing protein n=1 Tax=Periconia digitata TaxID=1303443 RepID=A0A9W4U7E2_9PLEO|nr:unnamed protein product [Periconia digitata]